MLRRRFSSRRYRKRIFKRKTLKKVINRAMIKASTGTTKRGPLHYHALRYTGSVPAEQANAIAGVIPIDPSQHPRWQTFAGLYDTYKVVGATITIIPKANVNMTVSAAAAGGVQETIEQTVMYYKFDKDDNDLPANENQVLQENWAFRKNTKSFNIRIGMPRYAQYTNEDGGPMVRFGYHSAQDNPVVQDGFLKYYVQTPNDDFGNVWAAGFKYIVKLTLAFRDYHTAVNQPPPAAIGEKVTKQITL